MAGRAGLGGAPVGPRGRAPLIGGLKAIVIVSMIN